MRTQIVTKGDLKPLSFEIYKKTQQEKDTTRVHKLLWRDAMRALHPTFTKKKSFNFSQSGIG